MVTMPILVFPDWKKEFHVHVDASSVTLSIVLAQPRKGLIYHRMAFASKKLSTTKKKYTTMEREGLAMVHKSRHYLLTGNFKMYTDHSAFKYLVNKH